MAETMTNIMSKNELVQKIHNDFMTAETFIKNNDLVDFNLRKINAGQKISKFGFVNKENVLRRDAEINQMTKDLIDILPNYKRIFDNVNAKYPFFKAITAEQVLILCKKYNLFLSDTKNFIGNIPDKNISDLEKFEEHFYPEDSSEINFTENYFLKYNDEDFSKWINYEVQLNRINIEVEVQNNSRNRWGEFQLQSTETRRESLWRIYNLLFCDYRWHLDMFGHGEYEQKVMAEIRKLFRQNVGKSIPNIVPKNMNYKIIAPLSDFSFDDKDYRINAKSHEIENYVENTDKEEITLKITLPAAPDPIVLMPLDLTKFTKEPVGDKKMYLIVTAWGIEAQDELVINHKLN